MLVELRNGSYTPINDTHLHVKTEQDGLTLAILCNSTLENNPLVCVMTTLQDPVQQMSLFVLQVIGISIDVVSCVFYIGTFLVFSDIRTLFGKLVINLIVVILFGDMFYLMSLKAPEEDSVTEHYCEAIAIVTHFLFLARFSWMTLLSAYIAKTFYSAWQMRQPIKDKKKQCARLILGMTVGYSVPGALVVLCVCLNYTIKNSINYGRTPMGNCWIYRDKALYLAYVTPIAISILINLLLSIFSIAILKMVRSNNAAKKTREYRRLFQDCRVVFGIFAVMGITWIFGLIGLIGEVWSIDEMSWAWYPFVILSTCQAATLALAFLAKKDVFDFYSDKFSRMLSTIRRLFQREPPSRSTSNSSAKTSQSAETMNKTHDRSPSVEKGSSSQSNGNMEDSTKERGSLSTEGLQSPSATSTQAMVVEIKE